MFEYCADPSQLFGLTWLSCYLTTGTHFNFYWSFVTVLMLLYPQLPLARIVAADIAYAVPLTLVAGLGHASLGSVDWSLLGLLLAGSLPGIWLGARLVHKTPERVIRSILSLLLAWAGTKLVMA